MFNAIRGGHRRLGKVATYSVTMSLLNGVQPYVGRAYTGRAYAGRAYVGRAYSVGPTPVGPTSVEPTP